MNKDNLPLQHLFSQLRDAGLPIGLNEYQLLLSALQGGFGTESISSLRQLCCSIWSKSPEDSSLINQCFDLTISKGLKQKNENNHAVKPQLRKKPRAYNRFHIAALISLFAVLTFGFIWIFALRRVQQPIVPTPNPTVDSSQPLTSSQTEDSRASDVGSDPSVRQLLILLSGSIAAATVTLGFIGLLLPRRLRLSTSRPFFTSSFKVTQEISDEVDRPASPYPSSSLTLKDNYFLQEDYLPVTQRQMKRSWRYLSQYVKKGGKGEIDIDATVFDISRQGFFSDIVFSASRTNRASLLIFIDYGGSMMPFSTLSERIVSTAARGGRLGSLGMYYFQNHPASSWNCPDDYLLYSEKSNADSSRRISSILGDLDSLQAGCLIVSDAGAARGGMNEYRIEETQAFLTLVKKKVRNLVWLNPLPEFRWSGTTAEAIAVHIPMVGLSSSGIDDAISILRGKNRKL